MPLPPEQTELVKYILNTPNMSKAVELLPILEILDKEIQAGNFQYVDDSLIELSRNLDKMSPTAMVSTARYTWRVRENFKEWKNFVNAVSDRLDELKLDSAHILRGLQ